MEFAAPRSALPPRLHASADSTNSYAHAAGSHLTSHPNIPSAAAPEPPAVPRRPRRTAPDLFLQLSFAKSATPNEYGWRFRSRAKVSIALSFFSFVCSALLAGTKSWTTGCLNRVSALCWRIGGGPSAGRNRQGRDRGRCLVSSVRNVGNAFTASGQPLLALARSERPEEFWLLSLRLAVASDVVWGVARIVTPKCVQHPRKLSRDSNGRNELATPQLNIGGPQ